MGDSAEAGTWVEIHRILLPPGERAPQVPEDTQRVPLELRAKGFLIAPASLGQETEVRTATGRRLRGTLTRINPAYDHGFGPPIPALVGIGPELRALLSQLEDEP
jgi:hypothetical protein